VIDRSPGASSKRARWALAPSRRGIAGVVGVLVAGWLAVTFGGALVQVDAAQHEAAEVRAANQALEAELAAGREEIALIQTDAFLLLQARAFGMGDPGERSFALDAGTVLPSIVPLGSDPQPAAPLTPLDEWLELLPP